MVSEILTETKALRNDLSRNHVEQEPTKTSFFNLVGCQFPLNSENDLGIFEEYLNRDQNFQNAVSIYIFKVLFYSANSLKQYFI